MADARSIPRDFDALGRLFALVTVDANGCWLTEGTTGAGYYCIRLSLAAYSVAGHRLTFRMLREVPKPYPYELDHLCRVRACVNPWHFEQVLHVENVLRGAVPEAARRRHQSRTHCRNGHELTPENVIERAPRKSSSRGNVCRGRDCRTCRTQRNHAAYLRWKPHRKDRPTATTTSNEVEKQAHPPSPMDTKEEPSR